MPTKDAEKINAVAYIDGRPIGGIKEITLPEISAAKGNFINKLKKADTDRKCGKRCADNPAQETQDRKNFKKSRFNRWLQSESV